MATRLTAPDDELDVVDQARIREDLTEPYMFTVRELGEGKGVKIIWWFIAVCENGDGGRHVCEEGFGVEWFECGDAVGRLTFETDREVMRRAVEIVRDTIR